MRCATSEVTEGVTFEQWTGWQEACRFLPCVLSFPGTALVPDWRPWWRKSACSLLLETGKAGRYTVLIPRVTQLLEGTEAGLQLVSTSSGRALEKIPGHPLEALRAWLRNRRLPRNPDLPFFHGGLVGLFSYDLVRVLESLPCRSQVDTDLPLLLFGVANEGFVYDHASSILHVFSLFENEPSAGGGNLRAAFEATRARLWKLKEEWDATAGIAPPAATADPAPAPAAEQVMRASLSAEEFVNAVRRIQEYIAAGHSYQVNLSVRQSRPLDTPPESVYEHLRAINPSPYMALLRFPGQTLVCGSPELLVQLHDGRLEARPIAGTRPRGGTADEDQSLTRELLLSEKERAEHLMLVDLIRNDLGRVSRYGSVRVSEFMSVENYSHVMHIVSHIEGELAAEKDALDVVAATFPGGTVTGAPKVRTMEIIEELEPHRRGPYTGSIGWLGYDGNLVLNIVIRTMLVENGIAHVQAGAGIVADSVPENEYSESLNKAKALWAAAARAEAGGAGR